jgi:hypothetical protein
MPGLFARLIKAAAVRALEAADGPWPLRILCAQALSPGGRRERAPGYVSA